MRFGGSVGDWLGLGETARQVIAGKTLFCGYINDGVREYPALSSNHFLRRGRAECEGPQVGLYIV